MITALESLIKQSIFDSIESIIIDDCSTDDSATNIQTWIESRNFKCKFIINEKNIGIPSSINKAITYATGEYYTFLADDLWASTYLESQLSLLQAANNDTAAVYSDVIEINSKGEIINPSFLKSKGFDLNKMPQGEIYHQILKKNCIPAIAALIKFEVYRDLNGYDENLITEDLDFWLRLSNKYKVIYNPMTLVFYRRYPTTFSFSKSNELIQNRSNIFKKHFGKSLEEDNIILPHLNQILPKLFLINKMDGLKWIFKIRQRRGIKNALIFFFIMCFKSSTQFLYNKIKIIYKQ